MGYWTGEITLAHGRTFDDVIISDGFVTKSRGLSDIYLSIPKTLFASNFLESDGIGGQLGAVWDERKATIRLAGNLGNFPAMPLFVMVGK